MANDESSSITLASALRDFLLSRHQGNLSPRTIAWYDEKLTTLFKGLEELPLSHFTIQLYRQRIAERLEQVKPTTVNHHVRAARAFFRYLVAEEYEVALDPAKIKTIRVEQRMPPVFTVEQIRALLAQPDLTTWTGKRNHAVIAFLADTGVRVGEVLGLSVDSISEQDGAARVVGKGNKERVVGLSLWLRKVLRKWMRVRGDGLGSAEEDGGWLFPTRSGGKLGYPYIARKIREYGVSAGIEGVRVSAHTFRSTFATAYCREGASIVLLQCMLGHSTLDMTRRYAALSSQDALEAGRRFSPLNGIDLEALPNGAGTHGRKNKNH